MEATGPYPYFSSSSGNNPPLQTVTDEPFPDSEHILKMDFDHFTPRAIHRVLTGDYILGTLPLLCRANSGSIPDFPLMVGVDDILPALEKLITPMIAPRVIQNLRMEFFDGKGSRFSEVEVTEQNVAQLIRLSGSAALRGLLVIVDKPKWVSCIGS